MAMAAAEYMGHTLFSWQFFLTAIPYNRMTGYVKSKAGEESPRKRNTGQHITEKMADDSRGYARDRRQDRNAEPADAFPNLLPSASKGTAACASAYAAVWGE